MLHSVLHPQVHDNGVKKKNSVNQVHIATSCERYPFGRILSGARELENHNMVWRQILAHLLLRSASTSDFLPCHLGMGSSCRTAAIVALTSVGHEYCCLLLWMATVWSPVELRTTCSKHSCLLTGYRLAVTDAVML